MRIQAASVRDAALLLGGALNAVAALAVARMRGISHVSSVGEDRAER